MAEKDDWRLLNDVEHLKGKYLAPSDGEELARHAPWLKACAFCWEEARKRPRRRWYVPEDAGCCVCEDCFRDFREPFGWKPLDGWDIDWTARCPRCGRPLTAISSQDCLYSCEDCGISYSEDLEDI